MSQLHMMKTGEIAPKKLTKMAPSPRQGTHTKTRAKTARALGQNFTPTQGWRDRKVGEAGKDYQKRVRAGFVKQAKAAKKGDKVTS